ncbi:MBL fold metallo-hydrolase [Candidatus Woesearchaeota archaeon]|nr:MBL fold metallo-hydrolase [Candidatus Woesearchaeota archaeon]
MEISVIASGSNGNCCLIEDKGNSVLVDAGKSGREIMERMNFLGKHIESVNAILITHKHSDHTRGAGVLSRRFKIPVYMTKKTSEGIMLGSFDTKIFEVGKRFRIGKMDIKPVQTSHNVPSCGFVFNSKFGIMTDTGCVTKEMKDAVKKIEAVLLESNHDIDMVIKGPYPYFLKNWILSNEGHLSNIDASSLLQDYSKNLKLAILGHLSGNNNTPELAMKTFEALVKKKIEPAVACRDKATGVFEI